MSVFEHECAKLRTFHMGWWIGQVFCQKRLSLKEDWQWFLEEDWKWLQWVWDDDRVFEEIWEGYWERMRTRNRPGAWVEEGNEVEEEIWGWEEEE